MASFTFQENGVDVVNKTFTPADFDANGMWHSDDFVINSETRVTANITYSSLTPDGSATTVDYRLQAVLEGQEDSGDWLPLVRQFNSHYKSENASVRRLIATSGPTAYDPDFGHIIPDALGNEAVEVTVADVDIPGKVRMCLSLADTNSGNDDLTSVVISMTGQKT